MATNYKATVKGACWKQHTCVICGSAYRYKMQRSSESTASTPQKAQQSAQANLQKALEKGVDMRPCPHCGLMQPEMIGQKRVDDHGCMIMLSFLLAVVLWACYGWGWAQFKTLSYIGLGVTAFITFRHILISVKNPNDNLGANKAKSAEAVQTGVLVLIQPGNDPGLGSVPTAITGGMKLAMLMLLAAILAFPAAELVRMASGWPYNDNCDPPVAGPGETVRFYTGDTIKSLKGYWNGEPKLTVQNEAELGLGSSSDTFSVSSHTGSWGYTVYYKTNETHDSSDVYVDIGVPNVPALAGKTAVLDLAIKVTSPLATTSSVLTTQTDNFKRNLHLAMTTPGAGERYIQIWWSGMGAGLVLQIIAGFILATHAGKLKKGLPTQMFPIT